MQKIREETLGLFSFPQPEFRPEPAFEPHCHHINSVNFNVLSIYERKIAPCLSRSIIIDAQLKILKERIGIY